MISRKGSANGLIENPYRFHRKNTLVITKQEKTCIMQMVSVKKRKQ